jgi:hypothetical protein
VTECRPSRWGTHNNAFHRTLGVMNPLARFDQFLFTDGDADVMRAEFKPVLTKATFAKDEPLTRLLETHKKVAGIYFWVLRHGTNEYKLYIGQTNSLANRLLNYVGEFQAHSPNDYKLRIFAAFLAELAPDAELDLYFAQTELGKLREAEKDAIRKYDPLLNKLPSPSAEAKEKLKSAFEFYYRSVFEQRLDK